MPTGRSVRRDEMVTTALYRKHSTENAGLARDTVPRCRACGGDIGERDYPAVWPFDSQCRCGPPVCQDALPWPCWCCGSLHHDRPARGTGCAMDEKWFRDNAAALRATSFPGIRPPASSTPRTPTARPGGQRPNRRPVAEPAPERGPRTWGS